MFRRVREIGPGGLVPLAWGFVAVAHGGGVADRTALIAHVVMAVVLVAFVAVSWREMADGALLAWRRVIVAGVPVTLAGLVSFLIEPGTAALQTVAVVGWMVLPAYGFWDTAGRFERVRHTQLYWGAAAASVVGAGVYLVGSVIGGSLTVWLFGILLAGVGQTVGILLAVVRY